MFGKLTLDRNNYPTLLRKIPDPPKTLYYKGDLDPGIFKYCLAVVGSREVTSYGKETIKHLFSTLSKRITIVSGFMSGVDFEAHTQALISGLKTIAVMPCGIDYIYPDRQIDLYKKIQGSGGIILSEYPGIFKPRSWTFVKRNRIVAGMGIATLVVESSLKSGSLITANFAHAYKRQVFVIPKDIFSKYSEGNIFLNNLFAKGVTSGCQINKYLNLGCDSNTGIDYKNNPILYILNSSVEDSGI